MLYLSSDGKIACWLLDPRLALKKEVRPGDFSELAEHLRESYLDVAGARLHLMYPINSQPSLKILLLSIQETSGEGAALNGSDQLGLPLPPKEVEAWAQTLTLAGFVTGILEISPSTPGLSGDVTFQRNIAASIADASKVLQEGKKRVGVDFGNGSIYLMTFGERAASIAARIHPPSAAGLILVCPSLKFTPSSDPKMAYFVVSGMQGLEAQSSPNFQALSARLALMNRNALKRYADLNCSQGKSNGPPRVLTADIVKWSKGEALTPFSTDAEFGQAVFGIPVPSAFQLRQGLFVSECYKHCADPNTSPWGKDASYSPDSVYIPKDLGECFEELAHLLSADDIASFKNGPEEKACIDMHMGLGMWMRNTWGLWAGSRLGFYFADLGVFHPDDMSAIILTSFHRHLNGKPIKLDKQISVYKKYWKKQSDEEGPSSSDRKGGIPLLNH